MAEMVVFKVVLASLRCDVSTICRPYTTAMFVCVRGSGGKNVIFSNCPYDKSEYSDPLIYIPI